MFDFGLRIWLRFSASRSRTRHFRLFIRRKPHKEIQHGSANQHDPGRRRNPLRVLHRAEGISARLLRGRGPAQRHALRRSHRQRPDHQRSELRARRSIRRRARADLVRHACLRTLQGGALEAGRKRARHLGEARRARQGRQGSGARRSLPLQVSRPLLRRSRAGLLHAPPARAGRHPQRAPASRPGADGRRLGLRARRSHHAQQPPDTRVPAQRHRPRPQSRFRTSACLRADRARTTFATSPHRPSPASTRTSSTTWLRWPTRSTATS